MLTMKTSHISDVLSLEACKGTSLRGFYKGKLSSDTIMALLSRISLRQSDYVKDDCSTSKLLCFSSRMVDFDDL